MRSIPNSYTSKNIFVHQTRWCRYSRKFLQAQHSLHGDKESRDVEGLKENLCSLFPVLTGVERSLSQQYRMLQKTENTKDTCTTRQRTLQYPISEMCDFTALQQERCLPPQRKSAAAPWNKRTARSSPCRSSPSLSRVPSDTSQTTSPCAPGQQKGGDTKSTTLPTDGFITCFMAQEKHCSSKLTHDCETSRLVFA